MVLGESRRACEMASRGPVATTLLLPSVCSPSPLPSSLNGSLSNPLTSSFPLGAWNGIIWSPGKAVALFFLKTNKQEVKMKHE